MTERIRQNWNQNQTLVGTTTMRYTILRDGTLRGVTVEKSSGFLVLDDAARRALGSVKLPALPNEYPNQELTVHLEFVYSP